MRPGALLTGLKLGDEFVGRGCQTNNRTGSPTGAEKAKTLKKLRHPSRALASSAPHISTATYSHWEIRRYLQATRRPGAFGYFTAAEDAK